MAIGIHIARVNFVAVDSLGNFLDKNGDTNSPATIAQMTDFRNEHRILEDSTLANSTGYPTVSDYLEAEAAIDYILHYMDQNTIITYEHAAGPLP